jgi:exopolysaccharide biosynthesis polyprenyl glycosylphosphotransferase
MIRRHVTALRLGLLAVDALSALILFALVSYVRFGASWPETWRTVGLDPWILAGLWAVVWVSALWLMNLYRIRARWSLRGEARDIIQGATLIAVATFSALFLFKLPDVSRLFLLVLFIAQAMTTFALRTMVRMSLRWLRGRGFSQRYMLVVGTGRSARRFADRVERHRELGVRVIGHLAVDAPHGATVGGRAVLGSVDDIEEILHDRVVDEVAICVDPDAVARIEPLARLCEDEGKIVRIPIDELHISIAGGRLEEFDRIPVISLVYGPDRAVSLAIKRLLDIVLGIAGLFVLAPVFGAIALWIIAVDGRPVLFRQERVGLHGRLFRVVKFRTMVPNAEAMLAGLSDQNEVKGHAFKITADPRLSRTGRILRSTSLDELPQLWNVVRGEMSLVGPRPPLPSEVLGYDLWHRRRLSMKPGVTGLWQVEARRDDEFDRWVALDLAYIDRWSVWLDFKIMLRTVPAMLQGR